MPDISRRAMLRAFTVTGIVGVGTGMGVGTYAYMADGEAFRSNVLQSGTLSLELATRMEYDGTVEVTPDQDPASFPSAFTSEPQIDVVVPEIDSRGPARGTTTLAFRACENPARVWLRVAGESSALADEIHVTASFSTRCDTAGTTVYDGSLTGFFDQFGNGALLGGCSPLGKIERDGSTLVVDAEDGTGDSLSVPEDIPGELAVEGPDGPATIRITDVYFKEEAGEDAEIIGVDIASEDVEFCRVDVKGGGKQPTPSSGAGSAVEPATNDGVVTYSFDCTSASTGLLAGETPAGTQSGLSHVTMYVCEDGCIGCEPACLTLDWRVAEPVSVAEESLSFVLELFANQCRNTEPSNPWQ